MEFQTIPILRIFDEDKAREFYLEFLGMHLDWEHRFETGFPIYMQVSKNNLVFHLSEHPDDCTPGGKVFVSVDNIDELYLEIASREYKYSKIEVEESPWGDRYFTVVDPFSNKILFNGP